MKTKLAIAIATALTTSAAFAQNDNRPEPPPPPPAGQPGAPDHPAPPPPPRGVERPEPGRHDGAPGGHRERPNPGDRPGNDGGRREGAQGERPRDKDGRRDESHDRDDRESERGDRDHDRGDLGPGRHGGDERDRPEMKPTPYLGVITAPVPPPVAAQTGLAEGFGLIVGEVVPGSPAATAGVEKFDVLSKLDDQLLTDPNQLATLVRSRKKDADVSLTFFRKGQEQKVTVKIGQRMMPERRPEGFGREMPRDFDHPGGAIDERIRRMHEQMQEHGKDMREHMEQFQKRMQEWQKNPRGAAPQMSPFGGGPQSLPPGSPRDLLHEAGPGGAPSVTVHQDDGTTTWNTAQAHVLLKDESGTIEVSAKDDSRTLTLKDAEGKVIFTGPVDTQEQRKAVPENVREKLDKIQLRARAQAHTGGGAQATADTAAPDAQAPSDAAGAAGIQ